jgi:hypothetical protein
MYFLHTNSWWPFSNSKICKNRSKHSCDYKHDCYLGHCSSHWVFSNTVFQELGLVASSDVREGMVPTWPVTKSYVHYMHWPNWVGIFPSLCLMAETDPAPKMFEKCQAGGQWSQKNVHV